MDPLRRATCRALAALTATFVSVCFLPSQTTAELPESAALAQAGAAAPDSGTATSAPGDDLGPTTAVPWNPPRAMSAELPWETAVRLPARIVTLVPSALGTIARNTLLVVEEQSLVPKVAFTLQVIPDIGVTARPASLGDRTGLGGTLRLSPKPVRKYLGAEFSGSTVKYNKTEIEAGYGPARLAYGYEWRPQDRFYGLGLGSSHEDTSSYASQSQRVSLMLSYPWGEDREKNPRTRVGAWVGPREMVVRRGRDDESPSFHVRFQRLGLAQLDDRREHLTYGASASWDGRSGRPHWSRGVRIAAQVERFDKPVKALALTDPRDAGAQFTRYAAEAEAGASFFRDPRTVRLLVRVVNNAATGASGPFLLPDLAKLGGKEGLAGFEPGRFHDADLVAGKLTYVFPLAQHFEVDLHAEAGGVYPSLNDVKPSSFENSWGAALRPRTKTAPLGMIGVDWSHEKVRVRFALGGVE